MCCSLLLVECCLWQLNISRLPAANRTVVEGPLCVCCSKLILFIAIVGVVDHLYLSRDAFLLLGDATAETIFDAKPNSLNLCLKALCVELRPLLVLSRAIEQRAGCLSPQTTKWRTPPIAPSVMVPVVSTSSNFFLSHPKTPPSSIPKPQSTRQNTPRLSVFDWSC